MKNERKTILSRLLFRVESGGQPVAAGWMSVLAGKIYFVGSGSQPEAADCVSGLAVKYTLVKYVQ